MSHFAHLSVDNTLPPNHQDPPKSGRVKHTRSKRGCLTCRKRKVRCGEEKPSCAACTRLQLSCTWPQPVALDASRGFDMTPQGNVTSLSASASLPPPQPSQPSFTPSSIYGSSPPINLTTPESPLQTPAQDRGTPYHPVLPGLHHSHPFPPNSLSHSTLPSAGLPPISARMPHDQAIQSNHIHPQNMSPSFPPPLLSQPQLSHQQHLMSPGIPSQPRMPARPAQQPHQQGPLPLQRAPSHSSTAPPPSPLPPPRKGDFYVPPNFFSLPTFSDVPFDMLQSVNSSALDLIDLEGNPTMASLASFLDPEQSVQLGNTPLATGGPVKTEDGEDSRVEEGMLVQHFLNDLSAWTVMRDQGVPNYYHNIYTKALNNSALFDSLLALSAMHLSRTKVNDSERRNAVLSKLKSEARARFNAVQPILLAQALNSAGSIESDVEALIASVLLSTEYEIMRGAGHHNISIQMGIMRQLFSEAKPGFSFRLLSPALQRICIVLSSFDTRGALFGVGDASFISLLESEVLGAQGSLTDRLLRKTTDGWLAHSYKHLLGINCLTARIGLFDKHVRQQMARMTQESLAALLEEARELRKQLVELEEFFDSPTLDYINTFVDDPTTLNLDESNQLFVASLYNAAIIYFHRVLYSSGPSYRHRFLEHSPPRKAEEAARHILLSNIKVRGGQPEGLRALWPRSLFFAGLELNDTVYAQYVFASLDTATEIGGSLTVKTRRFLTEARKSERMLGHYCDLLDTMEETTGRFVM